MAYQKRLLFESLSLFLSSYVQDTLQSIPESPPMASLDDPAQGEYWRGLSTPPQCHAAPLEHETPRRNAPPQPATPHSRRRGVRDSQAPPSRHVSAAPSPQPPFTQVAQPSRWLKKGPSSTGRVAYVLFGGVGDEAGLYYNW